MNASEEDLKQVSQTPSDSTLKQWFPTWGPCPPQGGGHGLLPKLYLCMLDKYNHNNTFNGLIKVGLNPFRNILVPTFKNMVLFSNHTTVTSEPQ